MTHVWLVHATGEPQIPVALHVSTPLPEHCSAPGLQDPAHCPPTPPSVGLLQMPEHFEGVPHVPIAPHVSTLLPWQVVWFGAQTPAHAPPVQVWLTHVLGAPHVPSSAQTSTPLVELEHCTAPAAQATHMPFAHTGVSPEHMVWFCQAPLLSQICTLEPMHCV
jgi:hypothetical protein